MSSSEIQLKRLHIPSLELCPYSRLDQVVRLKINCRSCLVQNQNLVVCSSTILLTRGVCMFLAISVQPFPERFTTHLL